MEPVSNSGSITTGDPQSVEINDILGLNTASFVIQGTWEGQLFFQAKILGSPWFAISVCDAYALDGQVPTDTTVNGLYKAPITGYTDFRIYGVTTSGTANVYVGACEGVEVMQEVLSYTDVLVKNDSGAPVPVDQV